MSRRALAVIGVAVGTGVLILAFILLTGGGFSPEAYEDVVAGDTEQSVLDNLGEPDEKKTLEDLVDVSETGFATELDEHAIEESGRADVVNWYWVHDDKLYLLEMAKGQVENVPDEYPISCDAGGSVC